MQADQLWMINGKRKWIHFQKKKMIMLRVEKENERGQNHMEMETNL